MGEEEECFIPGKVELEQKVVQITAGDSHTAALTEEGEVWLWGTFRDSSGPIGGHRLISTLIQNKLS